MALACASNASTHKLANILLATAAQIDQALNYDVRLVIFTVFNVCLQLAIKKAAAEEEVAVKKKTKNIVTSSEYEKSRAWFGMTALKYNNISMWFGTQLVVLVNTHLNVC